MSIIISALAFVCAAVFSDNVSSQSIDSSIVCALRGPVRETVSIGKEQLSASCQSSSIPMIFDFSPSVVSTNEGGTGLGYSNIRIRGIDGSRTNVTLNGISLNDAESQQVFWVNIPALSRYLDRAVLRRGLSAADGGEGSFGASIDLVTREQSTPSVELSAGSFGTVSLFAECGLESDGFTSMAAASFQRTDGFLRNGWADVQSFFCDIGKSWNRNIFHFTLLCSNQHTGITWEGIPLSRWNDGDYRYNPAGEYVDENGTLQYYPNQCDKYTQTHIQLSHRMKISGNLNWSTVVNCTPGHGYYEQFDSALMRAGRDCMDNTHLALRSAFDFLSPNNSSVFGLYLSSYSGEHFGQNETDCWQGRTYSNNALKQEMSYFLRTNHKICDCASVFAALQFRFLRHIMKGPDEYSNMLSLSPVWSFFNPNLGFSYDFSGSNSLSLNVSFTHREPTRSDLQADSSVMPESMLDLELSWKRRWKFAEVNAGLYSMEYRNMLLETGKINSSGYTVRENTPSAWRRGAEVSASLTPSGWLKLEGNASVSDCRINEYTAWLDTFEGGRFIGQTPRSYSRSPMLLSPRLTCMLASESSISGIKLRLWAKYVGRQYWDNTGSSDREIPSYWTLNARVKRQFRIGRFNLDARLESGNVLNRIYYAYAWVYRYIADGELRQTEGLFPQAPFNVNCSVVLAF